MNKAKIREAFEAALKTHTSELCSCYEGECRKLVEVCRQQKIERLLVLAALDDERSQQTKSVGFYAEEWRCFWCGTVFTDRESAHIHFGAQHSGKTVPECYKIEKRARRDAETANDELRARVQELEKEVEHWKNKFESERTRWRTKWMWRQ